ncbi:rRNA pseudouridine synthase [Paenibacillus alvei]|nr:pseudouridine synthase [Paenibacillus alvei]MCY9540674.1 rRNA pseudouridine synthase [Paenibacillus alvei]MCY9707075.1 rRNA pseudouridine synthase [Paenibacillus alvei]MCY9735179.1 rRNA pseudouridine synthase [Paenibacillus alvei]MCY9755981.1 rRNA pseudouridine synthase [Paenibacillus alvei]MEC0082400.1 pseudouridine synthase [Paenibacillus alvei]
MAKKMRLDKLLGHMGCGSRSEIKKWAKSGLIQVNGRLIKDSGVQVDPDIDEVMLDGEQIRYREFVYIMLNKPQGVISATEDLRERTVIDLLPDELRHFEPFPVGRLDKDTEGLLLLTNDGKLAHDLLSPKKHVPKTYVATVRGRVDNDDGAAFRQGVELDDGYVTKPAHLVISGHEEQADGTVHSFIELTITEGKFHQVKRMFESVGKQVIYLKRIQMGTLDLDPVLKLGEWRECTAEELEALQQHQQ